MRVPASLVLAASLAAASLAAQTEASLGLGVSTVRYTGSSSTSPSLSPNLQYASPGLFAGVSGTVALLGQGEWSDQGRANLWLASPPLLGRLRLAGDGTAAGTTHTGGPWTAAAHGLGELLWAAPRWGFGVAAGPSAGWIQEQPSVTVLHTRARAWWRLAGADWAAVVEPTRFLGAWFTDASLGFTASRGPVVASFWGLTRLSSTYGSKAAASAFVQVFATPWLAVEAGGGSLLPDPYQGLPRAGYVLLGLRLHSARRPARAVSMPSTSPLIPARQGDSLLIRFRMPRASSVALAGDWTAWQPTPLRPAGDDAWEGWVHLSPGLYHFVLLVDGTDWVVPGGITAVPDGMGGMTALLLVR
jgi:hypothetical protein